MGDLGGRVCAGGGGAASLCHRSTARNVASCNICELPAGRSICPKWEGGWEVEVEVASAVCCVACLGGGGGGSGCIGGCGQQQRAIQRIIFIVCRRAAIATTSTTTTTWKRNGQLTTTSIENRKQMLKGIKNHEKGEAIAAVASQGEGGGVEGERSSVSCFAFVFLHRK